MRLMKLTARTLYGLERVLMAELAESGAAETEILNRAVTFTGSLETMYRV
ncbi:MAG: hypothetical protein GX876_04990, partial [Bacteroidales bacterium]|nr:hypothetical protein [Bacteroidales bacterium]